MGYPIDGEVAHEAERKEESISIEGECMGPNIKECIDDILHYATQMEDLLQLARTDIEKEMTGATTNVNEVISDPLAPELPPQPTEEPASMAVDDPLQDSVMGDEDFQALLRDA